MYVHRYRKKLRVKRHGALSCLIRITQRGWPYRNGGIWCRRTHEWGHHSRPPWRASRWASRDGWSGGGSGTPGCRRQRPCRRIHIWPFRFTSSFRSTLKSWSIDRYNTRYFVKLQGLFLIFFTLSYTTAFFNVKLPWTRKKKPDTGRKIPFTFCVDFTYRKTPFVILTEGVRFQLSAALLLIFCNRLLLLHGWTQ